MSTNTLSKTLILILLFLILHTYFFSEVTSFFSQDDFFHLSSVMNKKISDIPSFFFLLSDEYAFYRPISRELYSFITFNLFRLNSLPYHLINLSLILVNGLLGIKFLVSLEKRLDSMLFKAIFLFIFLFSAVHSVELYYLSSIQTLLAASFTLLSLIFFLKNGFYSLVFFLAATMSHESSFVFLPIGFILKLLSTEGKVTKKIHTTFAYLLPFLIIFFVRVVIHLHGFGLDKSSTYTPSFSFQNILNTYLWYVLWNFGFPEMLVDFATLRLQFNPNLFNYYGDFTNIVFPTFLLLIILLVIFLVKLRRIIFKKAFIFLNLAFFFSLSPLVFFPTHKFIYYLSFPVILFSGILSYICFNLLYHNSKERIAIIIFLLAYFVISSQTLLINRVTYWAAKRAKSAEFILKDIKKKYPVLKKGSIIYVKDDPAYPFISKEWGTSSKQAFYILSGSDAFKLIFKDPNVKVYYEDVTGPPEKNNLNLVVYEARFPY